MMDSSAYSLKLAESEAELVAAQRLRYRVFVEELGAQVDEGSRRQKIEKDRFDEQYDHLIVVDNRIPDKGENVIGVYRLLRSEVASNGFGFYGANEYDLTKITDSGRSSVELGRSCVAPGHRGGPAMMMLWNGLAGYVLSRDIELLFGTASFPGVNVKDISQALSYLHKFHLAPPDLLVRALPDHALAMEILPDSQIDRTVALKQIPPLIKAYLRLGGFVGDGAWLDRTFNTIDVCLLLDTNRMSQKHRDYYARAQTA